MKHRLIATILALVASMITVGLVSTPASAGGGGCRSASWGGWSVSVCSSDNGVRVSGDVYVNTQGSGVCVLVYSIWDITTNQQKVSASPQACYPGRHPEIHTPKVAGHSYVNAVSASVNGSAVLYQESWVTY